MIIKRGTIFITKAGDAKHKIKFQWPNYRSEPVLNMLRLKLSAYDFWGGALVSEVGYHPRKKKKINVIKVVFQDKAMNARTSFRSAKTCKIGKRGIFLVILTNFEKNMMHKLRKKHAKMHI